MEWALPLLHYLEVVKQMKLQGHDIS